MPCWVRWRSVGGSGGGTDRGGNGREHLRKRRAGKHFFDFDLSGVPAKAPLRATHSFYPPNLVTRLSMIPTRRLFAGLILSLALLPLRSHATSVEAPAFNALVDQSDYIVRAVAKSVTPEWRENAGRRYIVTKVELEVIETLRGTPPSPLVLEMVGGRIGEQELIVEGAPRFYVGDENILFVHGNGRLVSPLVAIMHGLYPVMRDAQSGQEYVLRSNGMPLYSEQDVALPMTKLSALKQQNPSAKPMSATSFALLVRNNVTAQTTQKP